MKKRHWPIQTSIALSFTALMMVGMIFLSAVLYYVFNTQMITTQDTSSELLLDQASISMRDYLRSMLQIAETMNYSVIKNNDLADNSIEDGMSFLYAENQGTLVSIACFDRSGTLIASEPISTMKENANVIEQTWFKDAYDLNPVFSAPHIQNLYDRSSYQYFRVISLSQEVEFTRNGRTFPGVLVIDMNYNGLEEIFRNLNRDLSDGYTYLVDGTGTGTIIYHPYINMIDAGLYEEVSLPAELLNDGVYTKSYGGTNYSVAVKTVGYTGWKLIRAVPHHAILLDMQKTRYTIALVAVLLILILTILTGFISRRLTKPLEELTHSIENLKGDNLDGTIYEGGSAEVLYLGKSVKHMISRIRVLMDTIVKEQEEKRKSELDALQSQINPHFLYNTLDSIVWMIEAEHNKDAIFMIRQLASLFRISLSKGKTIISIEDELQHAKNYMNIQKIRYKDKFEVEYDIDPDVLDCKTVKLIVQPILENAIYYAVEALGGDGEIKVSAFHEGEDIYITVQDNGMGMTQEVVDKLLVEGEFVPKRGSGVGLINVHKRIQIRFGQQYGLSIESELDEGTKVTIHLPYQKFEGGGKNAR